MCFFRLPGGFRRSIRSTRSTLGSGNVLLPAPPGLPEKHKKHKKHVNKRMPPGIDARGELTTACFVEYGGVNYSVTRIDTFEGYKQDITLYCKRK